MVMQRSGSCHAFQATNYHHELRNGLTKSALNQGYRVGAGEAPADGELSPSFQNTYCKPLMGTLGTVYDSIRNIGRRDDLPILLR